MELNTYQERSKKFINKKLNGVSLRNHALFGMASEVGELQGLYQKGYQGHTIDMEHMKKELGDVLWFIAEFATCYGWDLDEIAQMNIDKLESRYPNGFEEIRSLKRKAGDI